MEKELNHFPQQQFFSLKLRPKINSYIFGQKWRLQEKLTFQQNYLITLISLTLYFWK